MQVHTTQKALTATLNDQQQTAILGQSGCKVPQRTDIQSQIVIYLQAHKSRHISNISNNKPEIKHLRGKSTIFTIIIAGTCKIILSSRSPYSTYLHILSSRSPYCTYRIPSLWTKQESRLLSYFPSQFPDNWKQRQAQESEGTQSQPQIGWEPCTYGIYTAGTVIVQIKLKQSIRLKLSQLC